jgi:hypothetical protein
MVMQHAAAARLRLGLPTLKKCTAQMRLIFSDNHGHAGCAVQQMVLLLCPSNNVRSYGLKCLPRWGGRRGLGCFACLHTPCLYRIHL